MNIGDLVFGFRGDGKPLEKDAKAAGLKAGETAGKAFDGSFSGRIKSLKADFARGGGIPGALLGGVGIGAGLGAFGLITKGIGAAADAMGDALNSASDLAEQQSKVAVVFGDSAESILAWGKGASTGLGLSERAALTAAGTFGNMFTAMGLSSSAAADMSRDVVQLGVDLAAFNNIAGDDALEKLRAGLTGEAEPLKALGIVLTEAGTKARGLAMGLGDARGQLSEAAKVQARYAEIVKQSSKAQGNFRDTSDGLAGSQKILNARIEDLSASIGSLLVGPADGFVDWVTAIVGPTTNAASGIAKLTEETDKLVAASASAPSGTPGEGTIWGSMSDGVSSLLKVMLPAEAELNDWADRMKGTMPITKALRGDYLKLAEQVRNAGGSFEDYRRAIQGTPEMVAALREAIVGLITGFAGSGETVDAMAAWRIQIINPVKDATDEVVRRGERMPGKLSDALRAGRGDVRDAMQDLKWAMNHPLAGQEYRAWLKGKLTGDRLAAGLRSKKPHIRRAAQDTYRVLETELVASLTRMGRKLEGWNVGVVVNPSRPGKKGNRQDRHDDTGTGGAEEPPELASGLARVPFDNYAAMLHRNEAVLTASEARQWRSGLPSMGRTAPTFADAGVVGSQTVSHTGTVDVRLSPDTISAMRAQGASWADVGRVAGAATSVIASPTQAIRRWRS